MPQLPDAQGCHDRACDHPITAHRFELVRQRGAAVEDGVAAQYVVTIVHNAAMGGSAITRLAFQAHPHAMEYVAAARDAGAQVVIDDVRVATIFRSRHPLPAPPRVVHVPALDPGLQLALHTDCRRGRRCPATHHYVTVTRTSDPDRVAIVVKHGRRPGDVNTNTVTYTRVSDACEDFRHWSRLAGAHITIEGEGFRRMMWEAASDRPSADQPVTMLRPPQVVPVPAAVNLFGMRLVQDRHMPDNQLVFMGSDGNVTVTQMEPTPMPAGLTEQIIRRALDRLRASSHAQPEALIVHPAVYSMICGMDVGRGVDQSAPVPRSAARFTDSPGSDDPLEDR